MSRREIEENFLEKELLRVSNGMDNPILQLQSTEKPFIVSCEIAAQKIKAFRKRLPRLVKFAQFVRKFRIRLRTI